MKAKQVKALYPVAFVIIAVARMFPSLALTESAVRAELISRSDEQTLEMLRRVFPEAGYYTRSNICSILQWG